MKAEDPQQERVPSLRAKGLSLAEASETSLDLYRLAQASLDSPDHWFMQHEEIRRSQGRLGLHLWDLSKF